ncbi:MAG: acetyl-CoA C-acetyltransferase [Anaerococcus sp.]|jgi:acetyl-CoA C-acetyltransferase|nr:acetyl-CoA C-acetyltransferase [Peptoniphilaceae bacterium]MDY3055992.1 acetyl-CoA C-acetyltransferase [Anaerococcus sp.]
MTNKRDVVVVSYARTPFGKLGGSLKSLQAVDLGAHAIKSALEKIDLDPKEVDYAYLGQVLQAGAGQQPARQATIKAGLDWETPALLINKVCSSGIMAIQLGMMRIQLGKSDVVVAGGMESMSNTPYGLKDMRFGARMFDKNVVDLMVHDGLWDAFYDRHMAVNGSEVAEEYGVTREEQDEFALRSQKLAVKAMKEGKLKGQISPIEIKDRKGNVTLVEEDEAPRENASLEAMAKLPPVFSKDGSVTAGNAPGVNDGGAAVVLMSREKAEALGLEVLATLVDYAEVSQDSKYIPTVPGLSTNKLLKNNNMTVDDIDYFEVNEAFAAVPLVSQKIAKYDLEKVNVFGGAVAFGHPVGATGARIVMALIEVLKQKGGKYGVAAICSGAAQGDALLVRVD